LMPKSVLIALVFSSCRFLGTEPVLTEGSLDDDAGLPSIRVLFQCPTLLHPYLTIQATSCAVVRPANASICCDG
jgi:hypothetical protein